MIVTDVIIAGVSPCLRQTEMQLSLFSEYCRSQQLQFPDESDSSLSE